MDCNSSQVKKLCTIDADCSQSHVLLSGSLFAVLAVDERDISVLLHPASSGCYLVNSDCYSFESFVVRKFADIGQTVSEQYHCGLLSISEWSDFVTVHSLPGSGVISALKQVIIGLPEGR